MFNYGFSVVPSEILDHDSKFEEESAGTRFVEFYSVTKPGKIGADFYYRKNFAKSNFVTIEELKARFPLSFKEGNAVNEYIKSFRPEE